MYGRRLRTGMRSALTALVATLATITPLQGQDVRGYIGVKLECTNCRLKTTNETAVWSFTTPPRISWVGEDGPAARAGLEPGDVIVAVNGVDIVTDEGGRLFGGLRAGVPAELSVRREGEALTIEVTPASQTEAFGAAYAYLIEPGRWDSVRVQLRQLYEGQVKLKSALREAEQALERTESEALQARSEQGRHLAEEQRARIDSMRRQLSEWQVQLRLHADSLAARTLYVTPRAVPKVELVLPTAPDARSITLYSNAVAGARFEELSEGNPLVTYFPGVESGLLITRVVENTPAHVAGLREGDVVLAVDGERVQSVAELRRKLRDSDEAELTYVRKGKEQTCKIPPK